jgi:UDP-N-acetylglucosamine 2-epimerase (non-hydrolysing)
MTLHCDLVVGTRPNFMKAAPVAEALRAASDRFAVRLIHTGQHYDAALSDLLFTQLGMPQPDLNLAVGSATQTTQTARIMTGLEEVFTAARPGLVVVFGDVNSTLAASLVAAKLDIPVAHVESGLRSFDRSMPEEINRVVTDAVADLLFVTEPSGIENLRREGVPDAAVHFVGNTMIDTLVKHRPRAQALRVHERLGLAARGYVVVTLHRPSNVDDASQLQRIADALMLLAGRIPVAFPVHPRTAARLRAAGLWDPLQGTAGIHLVEPLGYLEFLGLMDAAAVILTDSGGVQEESLILGVPCVTLRTTTERPVTVAAGGNVLVGDDPADGVAAVVAALTAEGRPAASAPETWDGHAGARIAHVLGEWVDAGRPLRHR